MRAFGSQGRWRRLALALGLCAAGLAETGCGGSSTVVEGNLSENARKAVFQKRMDVKGSTSARRGSRSLSPRR